MKNKKKSIIHYIGQFKSAEYIYFLKAYNSINKYLRDVYGCNEDRGGAWKNMAITRIDVTIIRIIRIFFIHPLGTLPNIIISL